MFHLSLYPTLPPSLFHSLLLPPSPFPPSLPLPSLHPSTPPPLHHFLSPHLLLSLFPRVNPQHYYYYINYWYSWSTFHTAHFPSWLCHACSVAWCLVPTPVCTLLCRVYTTLHADRYVDMRAGGGGGSAVMTINNNMKIILIKRKRTTICCLEMVRWEFSLFWLTVLVKFWQMNLKTREKGRT